MAMMLALPSLKSWLDESEELSAGLLIGLMSAKMQTMFSRSLGQTRLLLR